MNTGNLLVVADDFGWTDGHNLAVERAHAAGLLNAASLMTTTTGFRQAVGIALDHPDLQLGVHLVLNDTIPLGPGSAISILTRSDGRFHEGVGSLFGLWAAGKLRTTDVKDEWRLQIEKALSAGVQVRRLDSHKHVHMIPPLLDAAITLAAEFDIPYLRLPLEAFSGEVWRRLPGWAGLSLMAVRGRVRMARAGLQFADRFIGFGRSGRMTAGNLRRALESVRGDERTEIMVHPAIRTGQVNALVRAIPALAGYRFEEELEALIEQRPQL